VFSGNILIMKGPRFQLQTS